MRKPMVTFCEDIADYLDKGATMDVIFDFIKRNYTSTLPVCYYGMHSQNSTLTF